jgi:predicted DNA-binding WGR domain protein
MNPILRTAAIRRIVAQHTKVAHRPYMPEITLAAYRDGMAMMLYFIDAQKNHSKFYEMAIIPDDFGTFTLRKMWGALTDLAKGKRPTQDEVGLAIPEAKRMMAAHARSKLAKGYQDAFKNRPLGQYPVGLEREVGFGWGTQSATKCVPALRNLLAEISTAIEAGMVGDANEVAQSLGDAQRFMAQIEDSSMLREIEKLIYGPVSRLRGHPRFIPDQDKTMAELKRLSNYLRRQLSECNV